jgi:hypothetical protein
MEGSSVKRNSMPEKLTTEIFIKRATEIHKGKYDYSNVEYTNSQGKVEIVCIKHGVFKQKAYSHLQGIGCKSCSYDFKVENNKLPPEEYLRRCVEKHGDLYDYSRSVFGNNATKVIIRCKIHGDFLQPPITHMNGAHCPRCVGERVSDKQSMKYDEFIERVKLKYNNSLDYSRVNFTGLSNTVEIICKDHGSFTQTPRNHLQRKGCPTCYAIASRRSNITTEKFIEKAEVVHGGRYCYKYTEYYRSEVKVKIRCRLHGIFEQTPSNHVANHGCPACAESGFSTKKSGWLYLLKCGDITKIGITNVSATSRALDMTESYGAEFNVLRTYYFSEGLVPNSVETNVLRELRKEYKSPLSKFRGSSECFLNVNISKLVEMIDDEIIKEKREKW